MTIGLFPFAIGGAYSSTLRENGQTVVPMAASISAVVTNTALNYVLIFGKLGVPAMGVRGAAVATVIARAFEAFLYIFITYTLNHTIISFFHTKSEYMTIYLLRIEL